MIFQDLLISGVPLLEKAIRTVVVYIFLIIGLRLAGKRELAQLNSFDLVVLLTLSNTVQNAIIGNDNSLLGGLFGAAMLLVTNALVNRFLYRHPELERKVEGEPVILISHGQVIQKNLKREQIPLEELRAAIHRQGVEEISDVDKAILETSGTISVFARHPTPQEAAEQVRLDRLDRLEETLSRILAILEGMAGARPAGRAD